MSMFVVFMLISVRLFSVFGQNEEESSDLQKLHGKLVLDEKQFPYQVSIYIATTKKYCSGTIIAPNIILTTAFCAASGSTPKEFLVRTGSVFLSKGGETYNVDRKTIFPGYRNQWGGDLDIAVMYLDRNITFSTTIYAAVLPEECEDIPSSIILTGWRKLTGGGVFGDQARYIEYPIIPKDNCLDLYKNRDVDLNSMLPRIFCAGLPVDGRAGCSLGSSAAVVQNTLYGLYVWSQGCGSIGYPDVFTSISSFRGWIRAETGV